jgi:hypothetical protein
LPPAAPGTPVAAQHAATPEEPAVAETHSPADDIVYNLVSIQYHALKATQAYAQYAEDAAGHDDVLEFVEQCRQEDARRAQRAHELLGKLTAQRGGGIG